MEAIYYSDDVPDEWAEYVQANVEFFDDIGSPQGAAGLGKLGRDHAVIAAEPVAEPAETAPGRDRRNPMSRRVLGPPTGEAAPNSPRSGSGSTAGSADCPPSKGAATVR